MKKCKGCGVDKSLDNFYRHKMMADGYLNFCKECSKQKVKDNRLKKIQHYQEYDKKRANLPKRIEARKAYQNSQKGKRAICSAKKIYIDRNPIKRAVHVITGNAIRKGVLIKRPCEQCGSINVHAHHDDYAFPLQVRWLCPQHHADWHKDNEPMNG